KQLDARFVAVFIEVLESKELAYRHGEDADFEAELAAEQQHFNRLSLQGATAALLLAPAGVSSLPSDGLGRDRVAQLPRAPRERGHRQRSADARRPRGPAPAPGGALRRGPG